MESYIPFTGSQAEKTGITRGRLRGLLASGSIRRVIRGVYVDSRAADSFELRIAALGLVVGAEHVVCDRTAAWIHGVDALALGEDPTRARPEVCVLPGRFPSERPELRTRTRALRARDVAGVGDLQVTTPLRTALDLGCVLRRRDALAAMDRLCGSHGIEPGELRREIERYRGRRGVIQLRALIPLIDLRTESPAETWTRLAIHDAGLPMPVSQWEVVVEGQRFRLDFAYPERLVAVEYDGEDFHSAPEALARDRERRRLLARAGWRVIVVRREGLTAMAGQLWIRELRAELARDPIMLRW